MRRISVVHECAPRRNIPHPAISFTMEVATNSKLSSIGMEDKKLIRQLKAGVYTKVTNKGLLVHYQSHADARCKRSLLRTILNRAHCLSSSPDLSTSSQGSLFFPSLERYRERMKNDGITLKGIFLKLIKYPEKLNASAITTISPPPPPLPPFNVSNGKRRC